MLTLPDQRVIVANGHIDPNTGEAQPLFEVYDAKIDQVVYSSADTPMQEYHLYPALLLLPWAPQSDQYLLYAFNGCTLGDLFTFDRSNQLRQYQALPTTYTVLAGYCSQSSAQAPATLLMLQPEDGYRAEVIQFGGFQLAEPGEACFCNLDGAPKSVRMRLDQETIENNQNAWLAEDMPSGTLSFVCCVCGEH
jgi:hypothetical protein